MLVDLYLLQTYFEEPAACMFEDDLVRRYGPAAVVEALADGLLERKPVPCGLDDAGGTGGRIRNLCRLSRAGHALAVAAALAQTPNGAYSKSLEKRPCT